MRYKIFNLVINTDVPLIVCISGSMRYFSYMLEIAQELTMRGYIVLMPFVIAENGSEAKYNLDELHKAKIDLCSIIYVVDQDKERKTPYVGNSTHDEIAYAYRSNKRIIYESAGGLELIR